MIVKNLTLMCAAILIFANCTRSSSNQDALPVLLAAASDPLCAGFVAPAGTQAPARAGTSNFSAAALKQKLAGFAPVTDTYFASAGEVIENRVFTNPDGTCLRLDNVSGVMVRNNHFINCKQAVDIIAPAADILVTENFIEKVNAGIHMKARREEVGPVSNARNVVVHNNRIENILAPTNAAERHGGAVGFQFARGCGLAVTSNSIVNDPGQSAPSDLINLFLSAGKPGDPIRIDYNLLRGGMIPSAYHTENTGGIVLGDGCVLVEDADGRSICDKQPGLFSEYQRAVGNVLIEPGKSGIGVSGGRSILVADNIVYGPMMKHSAHVGIGAYDTRNHNCVVYGPDDPGCIPYDPAQPTCRDITVRNNRVNWWQNRCILGVSFDANGECGALNDDWRFKPQVRLWPHNGDPQAVSYCGPIAGADHNFPQSEIETNRFQDADIDPDAYPN